MNNKYYNYEELVMESQMNYFDNPLLYRTGGTVFSLSERKSLRYEQQLQLFADKLNEADCIIVGGASGLSAAGGGDFYYDDTPSYRQYFGKFAEKYGFRGAFDGSFYRYDTPEEKWAYLATFLHTTQTVPIRKPYLDLNKLLQGKDFFILTTNQDTQFVKLYPEEKVAQIQGDHRYFQCSKECTDYIWDAVEPVKAMIEAMGDDTVIPTELIPRCPHCGAEAFPWVRGYGNFLQGERYHAEYAKMSKYIQANWDKKILFIELGVGRMTPMFIQEPFWMLTHNLPDAYYIGVNDKFSYLPETIEDKGIAILGNIADVLETVLALKQGDRRTE